MHYYLVDLHPPPELRFARQAGKAKWRDAGVVERGGLENRCPLTGTEGSNPSLSAIASADNKPAPRAGLSFPGFQARQKLAFVRVGKPGNETPHGVCLQMLCSYPTKGSRGA